MVKSKTGGVGVSTGVKGARISVNKQGVRTQIGSNGVYYREQHSFKNNVDKNGMKILNANGTYNLPPELKAKASTKQWVLIILGALSVFIGSQNDNIGMLFIAIIFLISSIFIKDTRQSLKYSMAAYHFVRGNFNKCLDYAYKARSMKDTEQVNKLIALTIKRMSQ